MGVIAQKLSNWNQGKGKAWNLGKAEHSCSELQTGCRLLQMKSPALESRLQGCGAQAQWLHGVWDLPRPRIEPASPAQAGGFFFTPEPREKPSFQLLIVQTVHVLTAGGNLKDLRLLIRFLLSCRDGGVDQQPARPTATAGSSSLCRNTGNFL